MSPFLDIGAADDVPRLGARVVFAGERRIAVFRTADDRFFALDDRCPHKGGPLSQGIVHGHRVTCPLHNFVIGLEDGRAVAPDEGCVARYDVALEDGRLKLALGSRQRVAAE
jgi:nitrite reductase (NADH) small subunit